MTPTFRILLLLITVATLPFLSPGVLLSLLALAAAALPFIPAPLRAKILTGVWRVRWLLVAIAALYTFVGDAPWPDAAARVAVLVCAVAAVQAAQHGVEPRRLAHGFARVLAPFGRLGVPTERFADRLVATLDAVPDVHALIAATPAPAGGTPLTRLADRAASVIAEIENGAVGATLSASRES